MNMKYNLISNITNRTKLLVLFACLIISVNATAKPAGSTEIYDGFKPVVQDSLQIIKVSLDLKNAEPIDFFKEIQEQTDIYFLYNNEDLKTLGKINIDVRNEPLGEVFEFIFSNSTLTYHFANNVVTIKKVTKGKALERTIIGRIRTVENEKLVGATVIIKGAYVGTTTNDVGLYSITINPRKKTTLVYSFLGMVTQEVVVNSSTSVIDVELQDDHQEVKEVVITGFEKVDKRKLTSSAISISGEALIEPTGLTVDKMMQGKLAGVQVLQNSSTPGVAPKIRIRGSSSILGNREPIWVIDGVVMSDPVKVSNSALNSLDKVNLVGNAISFLNPNDIERIDVLKDAAATAIYGVKAANGVVVVTTKRGKEGRMRINYSNSFSIKSRPSYNNLNLMNSSERIDLSEEIAERGLNFENIQSPKVGYEGLLQDLWNKDISYADFNKGVDRLRRINTDWFDELMTNSLSQSHNISMSGGNKKTTYYVSGGFADDQGIQLNTSAKRYTVNMNLSSQLSEKLNISLGLNSAYLDNERTHESIDLQSYAYNTSRALSLYNDDGSLFYYPAEVSRTLNSPYIYKNILNELDHTKESQVSSNIATNFQLGYQISKFLKFNGQLAYNQSNVNIESWADEQSFYITGDRQIPYGETIPQGVIPSIANPFGGELNTKNVRSSNLSSRASLSFGKAFNENYLDVQVGSAISSVKYKGIEHKMFGYLPDRGKTFVSEIPLEYQGYHTNLTIDENLPNISDNVTNTLSFFGILRYSLKGKYIFNFNFRSDGSNKFGQDEATRFLPAWSISGRWNLGREDFFMKHIRFVDELGIKASFGFQGNVSEDQTPNMIVQRGGFNATAQQYINNLLKFPNPNLTWEKTKSYQVGTDFSLFKGAVSGSFEYYYKEGEDQFVARKVSPTNGGSSFLINGGTILNKGWDLSLMFNLIRKKDLMWTMSINSGRNQNKVTDSGNPDQTQYREYLNGSLIRDGYSVNSFYSYRFAGLDSNGLPTFNGINFLDEEGNDIIKTDEAAIMSALEYSGKREPTFTGGLSQNIRFKQFSFSAAFQFSMGNKIRLFNLYDGEKQSFPLPNQNLSDEFVNRWKKPGDENFTDIPVVSDQKLRLAEINDIYITHSIGDNKWQMYNQGNHRVVSGDYLKCSSLGLSYSFKPELCKRLSLGSLALRVACNNVFTIADSRLNGQSPEQLGGSRTIPPQRTYSLSVNIAL